MTSAEVPGLELERTVELSAPIVGLGLNVEAANPMLVVSLQRRATELVRVDSYERRSRPLALAARSIQFGGGTATADGRYVRVENSTDAEGHLIAENIAPITALALIPYTGGPLLVTGTGRDPLRIWDPLTGELLRQNEPTRVSVLFTYLGPDGQPRIASGGPTGKLQIWNPRLPVAVRVGPVFTRGFSDRVAREDLLDRGALVQALVQVLKPGEDDGPTVITVEGAWGSGKSTLLDFVRAELAEAPHELPVGRQLRVFGADRMLFKPPLREESKWEAPDKPMLVPFNPWRHQSSEQVWAGLATAVREAAEQTMLPDQNSRERYWFANNVERVDRRHLQRQLWKRIYSPLLSFAGLGFGVSALGALTKLNVTWAWWIAVGLAVLGLLHTGRRYFFGRASAFLPGELFAGPVVSNAFSGPVADPLIRDPYYHAKSGYLYLVQHDVKALLRDLAGKGYQLVLLIDDLDRCTPRTTAQVFEAINVFLADDFPASRFVLGLDTSVVASHVDHAYKELADSKVVVHSDDPSPGWTFLRKLVQLPVRLPRTTGDDVEQVLIAQLGPVHDAGAPPATPRLADDLTADDIRDSLWLATAIAAQPDAESSAESAEEMVISIERHAEVRHHLRRRLKAQPEQSVREEKRLLNVWQFYLRVLVCDDVEQACHLVVVAEIAVRWPAYLHRLRGGWLELADAIEDDVRWGATIAKLGYAYSDRKAAANLRELLQDCDVHAVAALASKLF